MSGEVTYDNTMPSELDRRWTLQAAEMTAVKGELGNASIAVLPPSAHAAARAFFDAWEDIALKAKVSSEVYSDELRAAGTSYENLDAEVARRMAALGGSS